MVELVSTYVGSYETGWKDYWTATKKLPCKAVLHHDWEYIVTKNL